MTQVIALTGATGFLGQHLLSTLLRAGYSVRALARNPEALSGYKSEHLTIFQGDLESDFTDWLDGVDSIIHLAGLVKAKNWKTYHVVNVSGAERIAIEAQRLNVKRFILMSSIAARAPELSHYAKSKFEGEAAVKTSYNGQLAIIRAPAVFGPGDKATKPIFDLMQKGLLPTAGGRGWKNRSLAMVYAPDLIQDIIENALTGRYDGQTVSPSSIGAMTMPEFAAFGSQALGKKITAFPIPLSLIFPIAAITTVTLRLFSLGHLSLGKLAEFRYEGWQSKDIVTNPTPIAQAIGDTIRSYVKTE